LHKKYPSIQLFKIIFLQDRNKGLMWQIAMVSGWESEGLGFEPRRLQATLDPGCQKNNKLLPAKTVCL